MSDNKTIKNFTVADIEKYWNKKLSPAEMHEMEKAAMDDPFFADALEGYQNSNTPAAEFAALQERFTKKNQEETPVIPLLRKKYYWFRVAVAIIVLVGSGLLIQQLVFKTKNETPIADIKKQDIENKETTKNENGDISISQGSFDTLKNGTTTITPIINKQDSKNKTGTRLNNTFAFTVTDSTKTDDRKAVVISEKNGEALQNGNVATPTKDVAKKEAEKKETIDDKANVVNEVVVVPKANNRSETEALFKTKTAADNYKNGFAFGNSFNYRVVDAQKNPVPFANVMNTRDNVGTYTDVRGYFNLVSSDSILNVQVKSLGYNSEYYKLAPSKQANDIVLKEDATARNVMNFSQQQRVMNSAVRKDSAEVEEPEVGWGNYNTYVENNIKIPENVRSKNALNQVELSFDIDRSGTPINIKVTKSSNCKECDDEAIRLLKEGPKWKKKGKRSKTTISISVDK